MCFLFQATGCALILHGTKQEVEISAEPSDGVEAKLDGKKVKLPKTFKLDRDTAHTVTAKRAGCLTVKEKIEPTFGTLGAWIDIVAIIVVGAGLLTLAVDWIAGSVYKFDRDEISLELECAGGAPPPGQLDSPQIRKKHRKEATDEEEEFEE